MPNDAIVSAGVYSSRWSSLVPNTSHTNLIKGGVSNHTLTLPFMGGYSFPIVRAPQLRSILTILRKGKSVNKHETGKRAALS